MWLRVGAPGEAPQGDGAREDGDPEGPQSPKRPV